MTDNEKLFETLGELLYVVTMADGIILDSERDKLKELLQDHNWASEISWSFNYEEAKKSSVEDVYAKVIAVCSRIGPSPIYNEFIESMEQIAKADDNVDEAETKIINSFSIDLIERFKRDIKNL